MKLTITLYLFILMSCGNNSEAISFSILTQEGQMKEVSKPTTAKELRSHKNLIKNSNFRKLSLTQTNRDNLIIEQRDEEGYLVLVTIRYEQFVIEEPLKTLEDVISIMCQYLELKDGIMKETKFY